MAFRRICDLIVGGIFAVPQPHLPDGFAIDLRRFQENNVTAFATDVGERSVTHWIGTIRQVACRRARGQEIEGTTASLVP